MIKDIKLDTLYSVQVGREEEYLIIIRKISVKNDKKYYKYDCLLVEPFSKENISLYTNSENSEDNIMIRKMCEFKQNFEKYQKYIKTLFEYRCGED